MKNFNEEEKAQEEFKRQMGLIPNGEVTEDKGVAPVGGDTEEENPEGNAEVKEEEGEVGGFITLENEEEKPEKETPLEIRKGKTSVKVPVDTYISDNESKLREYFSLKALNLTDMKDNELVFEGLKRDNPTWSREDIIDEMKDSYGVGLKVKTITSDMDEDEAEEARRYNERIEERVARGERLLKRDALKYKQDIKKLQDENVLPEFETELEYEYEQEGQSVEQLQDEVKKYVEEVWIPNVNNSVDKVNGIKKVVKVNTIEGKEEGLELTFKMTEVHKEKLRSHMAEYVAQPSDSQYVSEDGVVNYDALVQKEMLSLFSQDIINQMVTEGLSKMKGDFVKNKLVNYSDEGGKTTLGGGNDSTTDFFKERASKIKRNTDIFKI